MAAAAAVRFFFVYSQQRLDRPKEAIVVSPLGSRKGGAKSSLGIIRPPLPARSDPFLLLSACLLYHPLRLGHRRRHRAAGSGSSVYYDDNDNDIEEEEVDDIDDDDGDRERWGQTRRQAGGSSGGGRGAWRARDAGRLYVGNLPFSMTSSQLAEVFGEAGTVDAIEVVYDRVTDRSRGFAFVTMGSAEEAMEAIRMFDGSQLGGRTAKVNFPEVPRGGEREVMGPRIWEDHRQRAGVESSPHKVYAGNLSWAVTSETLGEAFAACPGFLGARVIYDRDTGRSRGYGFLSFASPDHTHAAIDAMNGVELEGRPLRLNLAAERGGTSASTGGSASVLPEEVEMDTAPGLISY